MKLLENILVDGLSREILGLIFEVELVLTNSVYIQFTVKAQHHSKTNKETGLWIKLDQISIDKSERLSGLGEHA